MTRLVGSRGAKITGQSVAVDVARDERGGGHPVGDASGDGRSRVYELSPLAEGLVPPLFESTRERAST